MHSYLVEVEFMEEAMSGHVVRNFCHLVEETFPGIPLFGWEFPLSRPEFPRSFQATVPDLRHLPACLQPLFSPLSPRLSLSPWVWITAGSFPEFTS